MDLIVSSLSKRPIAFHQIYAKALGGINSALFFQQIYFWGDKGWREDGYIYKTKKQIEGETTLSIKQQDRVRRLLEKMEVIKTELIKVNGSPTLHYKVDLDILYKRIIEYSKKEETSITENTTEKNVFSSKKEKTFISSKVKDERIPRIIEKFRQMCLKEVSVEPVFGVEEYKMVSRALNSLKMTEDKIYNLFRWWFALGRSDEETIHLRKALSTYQINNYRIINK